MRESAGVHPRVCSRVRYNMGEDVKIVVSPANLMERAGRLIGKLKLSPGVADPELRACAAWGAAAGPKIARHTTAVSLVRGTLVIEVADYAWQRQLATLQEFLLRNLAKILGEAVVTGLDFRPATPRRQPQRADNARAVRSPEPPRKLASDPAERIEDPVLELLYRQSRKTAQRAEGIPQKKKESA